ncbi:MAG TPA: gliding motility-associated C-terminal domain-containing protein [Saprospiraceae bacterium]
MTPGIKKHPFLLVLTLLLGGGISSIKAQDAIRASLSTPANAGILSESCSGPFSLIIERVESNTNTILITISDFGVALMGVDYTFPNGTFPLEMLPEDTAAIIPVTVINDGSPEGFETLSWQIAYMAGAESGMVTIESGITDEYEVEILSAEDTIEWCRYAPLTLNASSTAEIHWSPTFSFENPIGPTATVSPFLSGWYYASVGTDACGAKDSIYLDLAIAEIVGPDTLFICAGGTGIILQGQLDGLATTFEWLPSDTTLSDPNSLTPIATPSITTTYILQSDFSICIAADTVVVRVDSLPEDQHIDIAPLKAFYCAGEVVALFSPAYDSLDFPDITFNWLPNNGTFESPLTVYNAALTLQDTTLYIRENFNNACASKDSILINVIPPAVPLSVTDTTLCPGEMFTVVVLSDQVDEPEWSPSDGLSCTECLNPTVTVMGSPGSTIIYEFSGEINECPVGAVLLIEIPGLQEINIAGDNVVCAGESVPLTITNPAGLTGYNWSVTSGNASLSCTDCPNPIVTINETGAAEVLVTANTTNVNFCGAIGVFQFIPGEQPQVVGPSFQACLDGTVTVSTGNPDYTNVVWDVISGDLSLSCTACNNPVVTVHSTGRLRFFAEVSDPDICRVSGTVDISIYPGDVSEIMVTPDPFAAPFVGQGMNVMGTLNVNPPPTEVMWTINGVDISANTTTIEFNASEEVNFIEATFINSLGCEQTDTLSFPTVPPSIKIPNAFTPDNGDEYNDHFRIIITGDVEIEEFLVFNRWGQKVFDASETNTDGWDGTWKNEPAASDTYVYTATLRYPDGRKEIAKGDVMLLR